MISTLRSIFIAPQFFMAGACVVVIFVLAFPFPFLLEFAYFSLAVFFLLCSVNIVMLGHWKNAISAKRILSERFSNGDDNSVVIILENNTPMLFKATVYDETPAQFQHRASQFSVLLPAASAQSVQYTVRPVERGVYSFGALNIFISASIKFFERRYQFDENKSVSVYPSFLQLHQYQIAAISNALTMRGVKKIRRLGHSFTFDSLRQYVQGDDYRSINWKASARSSSLIVNHYSDEKAQSIYAIIDKGRAMKMPFDGMTLLDYAINSALALCNISLMHQDKAGLVSFSRDVSTAIPAESRQQQMHRLQEALYSETTDFSESDFEMLFIRLQRMERRRSLLIVYTNFETLSGLERQQASLKALARFHLVVVVFFRNAEIESLLKTPLAAAEDIYVKAVAEKFFLEKKRIVKELEKSGIHAILTTPSSLTADVVNKYIEIKARRML